MSYCDFCSTRDISDHHRIYHDQFYGFPIEDDNELFGRLILEINQAGLSWDTILRKQDNFRKAYDNFSIQKIAEYGAEKIEQLMQDTGVIRNRLKINSAIYNAQQVLQLCQEHGSFRQWLDDQHPKSKDEWTGIFKKTFKFVGGEIVNEFLMSTGYLPGAHDETCIIFERVEHLNPKWLQK